MKLVLVGSGTGIPIPDRASPSFALYIENQLILLDIGPGTIRRLSELGINHNSISNIFLTHFHPDHTADLVHFLFATRFPQILEKRKPFSLLGPQGLRDFISGLYGVYGKWLQLPDNIMDVAELFNDETDEKKFKGFSVVSGPVRHTPQSIAYRVYDRSGKSIVYSGDTEYCDEIIQLSMNCDLLVLECSFPDSDDMEGHLTPSLAARIATEAGAKKLLLVHFYPEIMGTKINDLVRKHYRGELILGRDSLHISV